MKPFTYLTNYFESKAKRDVLAQLRSMPEWQLLEYGFSPDLLKVGVTAWPWRMQAEPSETSEPLRFNRNLDNTLDYNALRGESERITVATNQKNTAGQEAAA